MKPARFIAAAAGARGAFSPSVRGCSSPSFPRHPGGGRPPRRPRRPFLGIELPPVCRLRRGGQPPAALLPSPPARRGPRFPFDHPPVRSASHRANGRGGLERTASPRLSPGFAVRFPFPSPGRKGASIPLRRAWIADQPNASSSSRPSRPLRERGSRSGGARRRWDSPATGWASRCASRSPCTRPCNRPTRWRCTWSRPMTPPFSPAGGDEARSCWRRASTTREMTCGGSTGRCLRT